MNRNWILVRLGIALAAAVPALNLALATPTANAAPNGHQAPAAVADYGSCLNGRHQGDLLLLIDQSGSLQKTDPQAARVTAAQYLIKNLAPQLQRANIDLSVAVAGFDATYHNVQNWTSLRNGGATKTTSAIAKLRTRDHGFETDYWTAIDGARRTLAHRAASGERCQAIVFFTDGELAISNRATANERHNYGSRKPYYDHDIRTPHNASAAAVAAATDLCRPTGVMNALRADGVKTFAIGLSAAGQNPNFGLLTRMATGRGGGATCGQITSPSPGTFQRATDIDSLLFAIDELLGPSVHTSEPVCQHRGHCATDGHRFVLDDSIGAVHILATSPVKDVAVELDPPGKASPVDLTHNASTVRIPSDPSISYSWSDNQTVAIDLAKPASPRQPWTGEWSLTFIDNTGSSRNAISHSNIHISGDIMPNWPNAGTTPVRSGEVLKNVVLGLQTVTGEPVRSTSLLGQASLSVALVDAQGNAKPIANNIGKAAIGQPIDIDFSETPPGAAALRLTLDLTTKAPQGGAGTQLAPAIQDIPLNVLPPFNYPTFKPPLNFGTITGTTHQTGHLTVIGPGCVWIPKGAGLQIEGAPADLGSLTVSSKNDTRDTCLKVPAGRTAHVNVTLANQHQGKGDLTAKLTVSTAPLGAGGTPITTPVNITGTFRHALSGTKFLLALLVALLLGLGLPALMIFIQKRLESRIPPGTLAFEQIPVQVADGSVIRNGSPLALQDTDFVHKRIEILNGSREVPIDGILLKARSTPTPGAPPHVLATATGRVMASSEPVHPSTKDLEGRLPINIRNNWVVLHDPAGPADRAELLLLVGADTSRDGRRKLVEDAATRVPRVLATLRQRAEQDGRATENLNAPTTPQNPWGGANPTAGQQNPWDTAPPRSQPQPQTPPRPQTRQNPPPPPPPPPARDDPWGLGGSR